MNLHQPLSVLPGVGPKSAEKFKKLGIETLEDLLLYFPFRYEDFKTRNVLELEDGEKAVISGVVATPANVQYYGYKRNRLRFSIKQGDQVIAVNFFNQPYLADKIEVQQTVAIFGKWDKAKGSLTGMKLLAQVEDEFAAGLSSDARSQPKQPGEIDQNSIRPGLGPAFRRERPPNLTRALSTYVSFPSSASYAFS